MTFLEVSKQVDAVITEDSDMIPFGCSRIIFKMDKFGQGVEFKYSRLQQNKELCFTGFTKQMLLEMCILSGCDYLQSLPGMGIKTAHSLIKKLGSYDKVIKHLKFNSANVPTLYEDSFKKAMWCFRYQRVYDPVSEDIVHLSKLPDDVNGDLDFLGPLLPQHIANGIAIGGLDPFTKLPFEKTSSSAVDDKNFQFKHSAPSTGRRKVDLPIQKNIVTNYFCFASLEAKRKFRAPRISNKEPKLSIGNLENPKNQADEKAIIHKSRGLPEVLLDLRKISGAPLYEDSVAVVEVGCDVEENLQPANNGVLVNTNEGISNGCCFEKYGFKAKNSKIYTTDNYSIENTRERSRVSKNAGMHKTMHKSSETAENNYCGVDYKNGLNETDTTKSELVPRTNSEEAVLSGIHTEKEFMRSYTNNVTEERAEDPICGTLGDHFLEKYGYKCSRTRRNALVSSNIGTVGDTPSTRVVDFRYANNNGGLLQELCGALPHDTVTKEGSGKDNECHPFDKFRFKDTPLKRRAAVDIGKENCRGKVLRLCASFPDRREEANMEKKFGCDISHLKSYSDCAEKSMDRLVSLISSAAFRGGARASGLRAPLGEANRRW